MSSMTSDLITILDPPSLGPKHPVYSAVMVLKISDTVNQINISGQIAMRPDGSVPETLPEQMDVCLERLNICLAAAGARKQDIVRLTYYFTEEAWETPKVLNLVADKMLPWLEGHRPTSSLPVLKSLSQPRFLCEFEVQAYVRIAA